MSIRGHHIWHIHTPAHNVICAVPTGTCLPLTAAGLRALCLLLLSSSALVTAPSYTMVTAAHGAPPQPYHHHAGVLACGAPCLPTLSPYTHTHLLRAARRHGRRLGCQAAHGRQRAQACADDAQRGHKVVPRHLAARQRALVQDEVAQRGEGDRHADGHEAAHKRHHVCQEGQRARRNQDGDGQACAQRQARQAGQRPAGAARRARGRRRHGLHGQRKLGDRVDEHQAGADGGQEGGQVEDDDVGGRLAVHEVAGRGDEGAQAGHQQEGHVEHLREALRLRHGRLDGGEHAVARVAERHDAKHEGQRAPQRHVGGRAGREVAGEQRVRHRRHHRAGGGDAKHAQEGQRAQVRQPHGGDHDRGGDEHVLARVLRQLLAQQAEHVVALQDEQQAAGAKQLNVDDGRHQQPPQLAERLLRNLLVPHHGACRQLAAGHHRGRALHQRLARVVGHDAHEPQQADAHPA
mmetsp:Transcript_23270/g.59460  ORF Transcript_23270/g.59460 Transcript_23270/m.59460 type:complete len:463 (-) Transcript_23270:385-1773(-)